MDQLPEESQLLATIENRYYNAVLEVTRDLLAEYRELFADDDFLILFTELVSGVHHFSTVTVENALGLWDARIRSDETMFRFVERASTASRFLSSLTWAEWSLLCTQLAMAMHPGNRSVYTDNYIDDCLLGGGNLKTDSGKFPPAVDKVIVDRTDIKATHAALVATPWLTWLYVASLIPFQKFEIKRRSKRNNDNTSNQRTGGFSVS